MVQITSVVFLFWRTSFLCSLILIRFAQDGLEGHSYLWWEEGVGMNSGLADYVLPPFPGKLPFNITPGCYIQESLMPY